MTNLRKPAAWERSSFDDLLNCEAGQAYVLDQLDPNSVAIQPDHTFRCSRKNCDSSSYKIYSDGSMWFVNNAADEVWGEYQSFVAEELIQALASQSRNCGCWTEDEYRDSDELHAWLIDDMDKSLLVLYCDGDENAARKLAGCERVESKAK